MANRSGRATIAKETLEILERGEYVVDGKVVDIRTPLATSREKTILYTPGASDRREACWL